MKNIEAKKFNKVLILKDVKNFTYTTEELAYHTEMYKFLYICIPSHHPF